MAVTKNDIRENFINLTYDNFNTEAMALLLTKKYVKLIDSNFLHSLLESVCMSGNLEMVKFLLSDQRLNCHAPLQKNNWCVLTDCGITGNMEILQYLLSCDVLLSNGEIVKPNIHESEESLLLNACTYGNFELVKYLLTSPELKEHADINIDQGRALVNAVSFGSIEMVEYLLCSSELKKHPKINADSGNALLTACRQMNFEMIRFLLTSPTLKEHANIDCKYSTVLCELIYFYHENEVPLEKVLEIMDYLLCSPELTQHADIHSNQNAFFEAAYNENVIEIFEHVIIKHDLQKTKKMDLFLKKKNSDFSHKIKNLFALRDLNKGLNEELPKNKSKHSFGKI